MGLVYACRHRELAGHMVAVKVLFPEVAQDKVAAARFRNEIFASYNVSHPNVVRAYEYLRDGDLVAYTMEYVGGGDLAERLSRNDRLPVSEVVRILSQMCAGVQAIHDAGIVHRDLKPENILLTKDGNVKIADFGIARNRHGPKLTEHGGVVGTIDYVSPEYMLNSQVDWRSDIYAIGILAYEMVTGESPFKGDSVYATMTKRLKTDPDPPSTLRDDCPDGLDRIILKAMQRDPQQRYQSAMEMFFDLQHLASDQGMKGALAGGAFIPNQPGVATGGYVGPSQVLSPGQNAGFASGPGNASSLSTVFQQAQAGSGGPNPAPYEEHIPTEVLSGDDVSMATAGAELAASNGVTRMDQVLSYNDLVSDGWESDARSPVANQTGSATRLGDRVRDLQSKYREQQQSQSYFVDGVLLVVAVILGAAFGLFFLQAFFPELVTSFASFGRRS
jgi:serine/threonine protein kinase